MLTLLEEVGAFLFSCLCRSISPIVFHAFVFFTPVLVSYVGIICKEQVGRFEMLRKGIKQLT